MSANSPVFDTFSKMIPPFLLNCETQAIILAGLCGVGAWVIFSWILQVILSILWPFFLFAAVLLAMPTWRRTLAQETLPRQLQILKEWTKKQAAALQMHFSKEKVAGN
ncbi:unnamed protein product [Brassicogethes aeneus]|uniref:Uncharacterized protein n=1 Tax=Brassicogethes aeneus TaxID=1431903 RepID=A0A9P0AYM3_BRAAE|nr:unnamed protein product [Brassicogethes aeneus]